MLTVVSESLGRSRILIDVARELSLTLSDFNNVESLDRLMGGRTRRFVILGEQDINNEVVDSLVRAKRIWPGRLWQSGLTSGQQPCQGRQNPCRISNH